MCRTKQIVAEPVGRNTAPAIGLAAFILERLDPNAVLGLFPSDHVTANEAQFRKDIAKAVSIAAAGKNIVVLGIKPTRPETGYGYIELGEQFERGVMRVRRFTEKPNAEKATEFLEPGNYFWNSGVFVWGARTLANALREHLRETAPFLEQIAASYGTKDFARTFARLYPKCENISVDYAVLEPRSAKGEHSSNIFCIPRRLGMERSWLLGCALRTSRCRTATPGRWQRCEFEGVVHAPRWRKFCAFAEEVCRRGRG